MHQKAASLSHRFLYQHKESLTHWTTIILSSNIPDRGNPGYSPENHHLISSILVGATCASASNLSITTCPDTICSLLCGFLSHLVIEPTVRVTGCVQEPTSCYWKQCRALQGFAAKAIMGLGSLHGLARPMLVLTDLTMSPIWLAKWKGFVSWLGNGCTKRVGEDKLLTQC